MSDVLNVPRAECAIDRLDAQALECLRASA
jgi:hypothetical protein